MDNWLFWFGVDFLGWFLWFGSLIVPTVAYPWDLSKLPEGPWVWYNYHIPPRKTPKKKSLTNWWILKKFSSFVFLIDWLYRDSALLIRNRLFVQMVIHNSFLYIFQWNHGKGMRSYSIVFIQMQLQTPWVCMLAALSKKARSGPRQSGFTLILSTKFWVEFASIQTTIARDGRPLANAPKIQNTWLARRIFQVTVERVAKCVKLVHNLVEYH